ncbi:lipoprotein-releasing ABC transporter permease subunit [Chelatococcus sp. SYSU_G07232]|uniref:Lipoprotein-releasing ABC transporter permease subunit n=1 Tax=Chelatococcus albus TaxID=3047466 RepID=A0ABT7ABL5_9HYPH|nr:lipoprotein-releasing ABC transporter permease subunit [Chelatococcus sp. SYSU_G07232]MDJ1156765.1 lipoprotein-releasing ABC transporter permease subunit [Chelatococcus sp. SYSU_G07232]
MSGAAHTGSTKPFAPFEWMLALRYLRARRREGFISVIAGFSFLGIMLGVATLIVVMSVMNGFRQELLSKIVGVNGHIFVQPIDKPLTDYAELSERLGRMPGVALVVPMVEGQALASSPYNNSGALVRGVRETDIARIPFIANNVRQGTLDGFDVKGGVAIGRRMAEYLSLRVGDSLTVVSPRGAATPFGTAPRIKSYPIVAVFEIGMSEFDGSFVYMPLAEAQAYFNRDGDVSVIELFLDDADKVDEARQRIEEGAERPLMLVDWRQRNRTFFSALEVERNVMFLILSLIVLVAALNIISGLIMLVKDKSEDIAILRTMGATRGAVMRVFLITGASIGVVGTIAGFGLGVALAANVEAIRAFLSRLTNSNLFPAELYFLSRLPAKIDVGEVTTVVVMAIALSLVATLYPSWRAAKLDPVEALRYG